MTRLTTEAVAADLREAMRINQGYLPTEADLGSAPLLSDWMIEPLPVDSSYT